MTKHSKLANRFKKLREELNTWEKDCTQEMLAQKLELQKSQISALENGKREPSMNVLIQYSEKLKVPMEYLLGVSDSRYYQNINVTDELGLSDKAIENLKRIKKVSKTILKYTESPLSEILNFLFSDYRTLVTFLIEIMTYSVKAAKQVDYENYLIDPKNQKSNKLELVDEYNAIKEETDISLFRVQRSLKKMLDAGLQEVIKDVNNGKLTTKKK